jgi:Tol biopolymer transport system component
MPARRLLIAVVAVALLTASNAVALGPLPARAPETGFAVVSQVEGPGLYVVDVDGRGLRRLAGPSMWPSWSRDGRRMAVVQGSGDVVVVDVATGEARVIGSGHRTIRAVPSWAPDNQRVAYPGPGEGWDRDVWIADATGSTPARRLVRPGDDPEVAWGPDGRLATVGSGGIVISAQDGSNAVSIPSGGGNFGPLRWSPDGTMLVNLPDSTSTDLIVNADGSNPRMLADSARGELSIWQADWAPTSRELVYFENAIRTGHTVVGIAPADGTAGRELTRDARDPAWSPRGDLIAVVADTGDGGHVKAAVSFGSQLLSDLAVITPDGNTTRIVVRSTLHLSTPVWSPDGTMLAFVAS